MSEKTSGAHAVLREGLQQMGIDVAPEQFLHYWALLEKWNRAYNLTAIRTLDEGVPRHLLDSLAICRWVQGQQILDVGSGGGLPGIPLALAFPERHVVLLDSNGKKSRFLCEAKRVLSLDNVDVVQSRVENYHPAHGFDTVVCRAFSSLSQLIAWTQHLMAENGVWLAMKGRLPEEELVDVDHPYRVEPYRVLGVAGERCCVIIENKKS